jgi:two-component system response regulator ChvI
LLKCQQSPRGHRPTHRFSATGDAPHGVVSAERFGRAYWNDVDLDLTLGEYNIVHLLASNVGRYVTYRKVYDRLHYEGFIAGTGPEGYRANVRSAIKRIRNKFRDLDPTFDKVENYTGFGYCWTKPA